MANSLYNGIKTNTDVSLVALDGTRRVLVLPNASEVSFDQGIELEEVMAATPLGEMSLVDIYPRQRNPQINLTFPKKTPELLGMKMGYAFEQVALLPAIAARNGVKVTNTSFPAAAQGYEGYGIVADAEGAEASYLDEDQVSVPLTQANFTGFTPSASTLSFAVGENGAMKFSDDLVGKYVSWAIPFNVVNGLSLSEMAFNRFALTLVMIQRDLRLFSLEFPEVISPGEGEINFNESTIQINFRMIYDGSACLPFRAKYLGQARKCDDAVAA